MTYLLTILALSAPGLNFFYGDYAPSIHDLWYAGADRDFIGEGYEFSGIGKKSAGQYWITLVTPHFALSAAHHAPSVGDTVLFYDETGDVAETAVVEWATSYLPTLIDCRILMLDRAVDSAFSRYPMLYISDAVEYAHKEVFFVGHRPNANGICVGRNYTLEYPAEYHGYWSWMEASWPDIPYCAQGGTGDSGAPSFTVVAGELALIGCHKYPSQDGLHAHHVGGINEAISNAPKHGAEQIRIVADMGAPELSVERSPSGITLRWDNTSGMSYDVLTRPSPDAEWTAYAAVTGQLQKAWAIPHPADAPHQEFAIRQQRIEAR